MSPRRRGLAVVQARFPRAAGYIYKNLALRWSQFDFDAGEVRLVTGKTHRVMEQAVSWDFLEWARERRKKVGGDWVHPRLRRHSNPSAEFTSLVRMHGIGLVGESSGGNRRVWHSKTFHSIRATVATLLQMGGISQGVAMELVGHDSAAVHAAYIRTSVEQRRSAGAVLHRLPRTKETPPDSTPAGNGAA